MYTNIDHASLLNEISSIIHCTLKDEWGLKIIGKEAIICRLENADYDKSDLVKMVEFVVMNTFFTMGDTLYKQVHGIPMGTDCAPQLANLFLHSLEHKFMMNNFRSRQRMTMQMNHTYRYIDDLTVINGKDTMDKIKKEIYPQYLELLRVNDSLNKADVLDITITKNKQKFTTKLYDKRHTLPFETICFPHTDSNIPLTLCYNTYFSQVTRYANINTSFEDFKESTKSLIQIISKRGYSRRKLKETTIQCLRKNKFICKKYLNMTIRDVIKGIFE
jgi:hypothetical protein